MTVRKVTLLLLLIISPLVGCSTTRTYWGDWRSWTGWEPTGKAESQVVSIKSYPEGGSVYVDGILKGSTPLILPLPYPVLSSERTRHKYEQVKPGLLESFFGTRSSTSKIDSEKEERLKVGSRAYVVEVRKEGYSLSKRRIFVPETTEVSFVLKKKPYLIIRKFSIKKNLKLSFFEKLSEILYGNRFSVDTSELEGLEKQFLNSKKVNDVFETGSGKLPDFELKGEIIVERDFIEIKTTLTDKSGMLVTQQKSRLETKKVGSLCEEVERLISTVVDSFLEKN